MRKILLIILFIVLPAFAFAATDYTADADCEGAWFMDGWTTTGSNSEADESDNSITLNEYSVSGIEQRSGTWGPTSANYIAGKSRIFRLSETENLYVTDASAGGLDVNGHNDLTITAWVKVISITSGTNYTIVSKWDDSPAGKQYLLRVQGTGTNTFKFQGFVSSDCDTSGVKGVNSTTTTYAADNSTWYHVAFVHDATDDEIRLYVNGNATPQGTTAHSGGICVSGTHGTDFVIGCAGDNTDLTNCMDGLIDEVAVFSAEMDTDEIGNIYDDGIDGSQGANDTTLDWYVSQGGTGTGLTSCESSPADLSAVNGFLGAGDTVTLCNDGGNFTTEVIAPGGNSYGLSSAWITYQGDSGGVTMDGSSAGANMLGSENVKMQYLEINGINFTKPDTSPANTYTIGEFIGTSSDFIEHIKIKNCDFGVDKDGTDLKYNLLLFEYVRYLELIGNTFDEDTTASDGGHDFVKMRKDTEKVLVYGNTGGECSHALFQGTEVNNIVFKNNTHTNKWRYAIQFANEVGDDDPSFVLIEGDTFQHTASEYYNNPQPASDDTCGYPLRIQGDHTNDTFIVRYNIIDSCCRNGIAIYNSDEYDNNNKYHQIYHNTIYNVQKESQDKTKWFSGMALVGLQDDASHPAPNWNFIVNNIFSVVTPFDNTDCVALNNPVSCCSDWETGTCNKRMAVFQDDYANTIENNIWYDPTVTLVLYGGNEQNVEWMDSNDGDWDNNEGNTNPIMIDPANDKFGPKTNSPMIDGARELTLTDDADGGSGTSMPVDSAKPFFAEETWDIPDTDDLIESDTIYVDNSILADFTVKITGVDYSPTPNTLTLASSQSWDDNAKVYICPDGVCFRGAAPDIGAIEYQPRAIPMF